MNGYPRTEGLRTVFEAYLTAKRELLAELEALAVKRRPELKPALRERFRLQGLYVERDTLRFEDLVNRGDVPLNGLRSLREVCQRIEQTWTEVEDAELARASARYRTVLEAIGGLSAVEDPDVSGQLRDLARDPDYVAVRQRASERIAQLQARTWEQGNNDGN